MAGSLTRGPRGPRRESHRGRRRAAEPGNSGPRLPLPSPDPEFLVALVVEAERFVGHPGVPLALVDGPGRVVRLGAALDGARPVTKFQLPASSYPSPTPGPS